MNHKLDLYIDQVKQLPPSPTLLLELLALFKEPDRDIDQVVKVISHDPSLTTEVLRRCNSAYFSGSQCADMFEAVMNLGLYEIYRIVMVIFGSQAMSIPASTGGFKMEVLWQHSVTTAVAAGIVADRTHETAGLAFTAGLLHDMGKVVLAMAPGSSYGQLTQAAGPCGLRLLKAEKERFGFDHSEVGERLLTRWGLPQDIFAAARHHHELAGAEPFERLAATVHLANLMAHELTDAPRAGTAAQSLVNGSESMEMLGFTAEDMRALAEETKAGLERIKALLKH